jgi:hypothetical protein
MARINLDAFDQTLTSASQAMVASMRRDAVHPGWPIPSWWTWRRRLEWNRQARRYLAHKAILERAGIYGLVPQRRDPRRRRELPLPPPRD